MESQISTGDHHGPGFDVPEQGLHLRLNEGGTWHGVLDTSMGPVGVDIVDDHVPEGDRVAPDETVVAVHEQFVGLRVDDQTMRGEIATGAGGIPFSRSRD